MEFSFTPEPQQPARNLGALSPDAVAALARKAGGMSAAELLWTDDSLESLGLSPEVAEWADSHFLPAVSQWAPYERSLQHPLPISGWAELPGALPDLSERLAALHAAAKKLEAERPARYDVLLVPYGDFAWQVDRDFVGWLGELRRTSGFQPDELPTGVTKRFHTNEPIQYDDDQSNGMSIKAHFDYMTRHHGNWGMLLIQHTKDRVGISAADARKQTLSRGNGYNDLGILEWLALTLQTSDFPYTDGPLLLTGSSLPTAGGELVMRGWFDDDNNRFAMDLQPAVRGYENTGVRLLHNAAWE